MSMERDVRAHPNRNGARTDTMSANEDTQLLPLGAGWGAQPGSGPAGPADLVLGRYSLRSVVGRGGMSTVYEAEDTAAGAAVAVKLLARHLGNDETSRRRLLAEANALASLRHPNIVALLDCGECPSRGVVLVMELVDGESLHERLQRGPLPVAAAISIAEQVGGALAYAHRAGIVHRDVKPHNVLLARSPSTPGVGGIQAVHAKLADFGIARSADATTTYTAAGSVVGSVPYIAPEVLRGEPADGRSDVYALGVSLFQMLAGKLPFAADVPAALLSQRLMHDAPPVERFRPEVPEDLARVVARALAREPDERWPTASDLVAELRSVAASGARRAEAATVEIVRPGAPAPSLPARRRLVFLAPFVAASLGFVAFAAARGAAQARPTDSAPRRGAVSAENEPAGPGLPTAQAGQDNRATPPGSTPLSGARVPAQDATPTREPSPTVAPPSAAARPAVKAATPVPPAPPGRPRRISLPSQPPESRVGGSRADRDHRVDSRSLKGKAKRKD
jgi:hypothetical protein